MKYTHIIWDFNGTLFNDVDAGIKAVNEMLSQRGLPTLDSKDDYRKVFKFPIIDYYKDLGFDFEKEPYEVLAPIWVDLYNKYSKESTLQPEAQNALEYFKALEIPQVLLSATEREMLMGQTDSLNISGYFEEILGLDNIHAYSKEEIAKRWRAEHPSANPLVIGDTEHDAAVARAIGADCFLVANGHGERARLDACEGSVVCVNLYHVGMAFQFRHFK
jgi:phosphoglycolate phosphatase